MQSILTPIEAVVGAALNALSRKFEWEADRFACELQDKLKAPEMSDMGDRLGRALVALHVKNLSTVWVDWLYVYFLLTVNPWLKMFFAFRYSAYHHSHPTLTERLKALEAFKARKGGAKAQTKKEL